MAMYQTLKKNDIYAQISPTPRELSVCCGVSILIKGEDTKRIRELATEKNLNYISIDGVNNTFDNTRHRYG